MKNIVGLLILVVPVLIFAGCKKSSSNTPAGPGAILATGKWQLTSDSSVQTTPGGGGTVTKNLFTDLQPCVADNFYLFSSIGITSTDEGATKCNAGDAQTKTTGTWQLQNGDTQLEMLEPVSGQLIIADMLQLDDNILKLHFTISAGITQVNTEVFTHIK